MLARAAVLVLALGLAAGCTGTHRAPRSLSSSRPAARPVGSTGCGRTPALRSGSTGSASVAVPPASAAGMRQREYWVHVPVGYSPRHSSALILAFHGAGGTGLGMAALSGLSALADRRGFLVAYPQGAKRDGRGWAWATSGPADPDAHGVDDAGYVGRVLDQIEADYCIDPARIAVTGFSNGANMVGYLACVLAGRIGAFAPVNGIFFNAPGGCHPSRPPSLLDVAVRTDPIATYAGSPARGQPDYYAPAVPSWLQQWARRDGCRPQPRQLLNAGGQTEQRWTDCDRAASITAYLRAGGGHSWPAVLEQVAAGTARAEPVNGTAVIVDFLLSHPLAAGGPWTPHPDSVVPTRTAPAAPVRGVREFRVPTANAEPVDVTAGTAGTVWFTEFAADKIGRIAADGAVREFDVPTPRAEPYLITLGGDDAIWFTEYNTTRLGRIGPDGRLREVTLPGWSAGGLGLAPAPPSAGFAGGVWITDPAGDLDRVAADGSVLRDRLSGSGTPFAITSTRTGIWLTQFTGFFQHTADLLHVDATGPAHAVSLPDPASDIDALTSDRAGDLWYTDPGTGHIGELSPSGRSRRFTDPLGLGALNDLTAAPDGAIWATDQAGMLTRISADGDLTQQPLPPAGSRPDGIAAAGHTLWVAETGSDTIARISL